MDRESQTNPETLEQLFVESRREELMDEARWPARELAQRCAEAMSAGMATDFVRSLIVARMLAPEGPHVAVWPWHLRIYTLGRFSIVRDGEPLMFNGKSPRKALELLQALIAMGGRDVHIGSLMRALWPDDASGRNPRKVFDNTLHRLRRLLGRDDAVVMSDAKLSLPLCCCWVDAWAFERLAGSEDEADLGQAVDLYHGLFLAREAETSWLLPFRDRLHSRFLRLVMQEGDLLEGRGEWEAAARLYESALELDNLVEALYRRLMNCHLRTGECAEVQRVYQRCRQMLSMVLGVAPSPRTEAIRKACQTA